MMRWMTGAIGDALQQQTPGAITNANHAGEHGRRAGGAAGETTGCLCKSVAGEHYQHDTIDPIVHSSVANTAAIYLHSYEDTKRAAVAGAAQLLSARKAG